MEVKFRCDTFGSVIDEISVRSELIHAEVQRFLLLRKAITRFAFLLNNGLTENTSLMIISECTRHKLEENLFHSTGECILPTRVL